MANTHVSRLSSYKQTRQKEGMSSIDFVDHGNIFGGIALTSGQRAHLVHPFVGGMLLTTADVRLVYGKVRAKMPI